MGNLVGFPDDPNQPLRAQPAVPQMAAPMPASMPMQQPMPQQQPQGQGLIDFFRSLFHRQNDLDNIMNQNGLRQPAQPAEGGVRG